MLISLTSFPAMMVTSYQIITKAVYVRSERLRSKMWMMGMYEIAA